MTPKNNNFTLQNTICIFQFYIMKILFSYAMGNTITLLSKTNNFVYV